MKRILRRQCICRALMGFLLLCSPGISRADEPDAWSKVDMAIELGLPRTAMEHLQPIIETALQEEAWAEAARAITLHIALESNVEGNRAEERIVRLDEEIARAPVPMQAVLQTIQAHWFWNYFRQNRWRYLQRSATAESPGDDILTWDLTRILGEIDTRFQAALESKERLQQIPIEEFDAFLVSGSLSDRYRPTLYDFIVASALEFYTSGEQAAAHPQDAFVLGADSPIFGSRGDFVNWHVTTTDEESPIYRAVRLYQQVIEFHAQQGSEHKDALLDWDLDRLRFGYNLAVGEEKNARYKASLRRFVEQESGHEVAARASYDWARLLFDEGNALVAHEIARRGAHLHPDSIGGRLCRSLLREIEAPSVSLSTERVWHTSRETIDVRYRNVSRAYFRLYPVDFVERLQQERRGWDPEYFDRRDIDALLTRSPAVAWDVDLPATPDYRERTERVSVPTALEPGFYVLVTSHQPGFDDQDNQIMAAPLWVSELALVMRTRPGVPRVEGFVLHAESGEPVPGATVRVWRHNFNAPPQEAFSVQTDADGLFVWDTELRFQHFLIAEAQGQRLAAASAFSGYVESRRTTRHERVTLFTDRAIYRPGQTIRFKGIVMMVDQDADSYAVAPGRALQVEFLDVNGERIEQLDVRSNDYGSFSGSFTAPRDRLMGQMTLRMRPVAGQATVRVEEYKRPTFRVQMAAPEVAPKLYDVVTVQGEATAYTGAAMDGAEVRWRVVRDVRMPGWWPWWRRGGMSRSAQEIAHGVTQTDVAGRFDVAFVARPDEAVDRDGQPVFRYTIHADVTDTAGETRSSQIVVNVGYVALEIVLSAPEWLEADQEALLKLRTLSLDGVGQASSLTLRIHELTSPQQVHRAPLAVSGRWWSQPVASQDDLSDPARWPLGPVVAEYALETGAAGEVEQRVQLGAGAYRLVAVSEDRFGQAVRAEVTRIVHQPEARRLALPMPFLFDAPTWTMEPGDMWQALWGSGYDRARAYVEVEHRGEIVQRYWTDPAVTQQEIPVMVTEGMRGGFTVRVTMVRENRAYLEQRQIDVPWTNQELQLSWERFTSRLEPGQSETWSLVIRGSDAEFAAAEMVATLYDQSLDAFLPHPWPERFQVFRQDHSRWQVTFQNATTGLRVMRGRWPSWSRPVATYRRFPPEIIGYLWGYDAVRRVDSPLMMTGLFAGRSEGVPTRSRQGMGYVAASPMAMELDSAQADTEAEAASLEEESVPLPDMDLDQVQTRVNLQETAFFFPHLQADGDGVVRLTFTMPEALTQWRFMGFAHDRSLRSGLLTGTTVTAKDLMVRPNPPRFVREGDELEFTVRVVNQSSVRQTGRVRLTFSDARTGDRMDAALGLTETEQLFDIPAQESRSFGWRIRVPDGADFMVYRAVAASEHLADGEEAYLPVLSRRVFVMESLPLPIRGPDTREFTLQSLVASGESDTLQHQNMIVQMVSNPAWYAVLALPYLMEFPHACSEQVFSRLYANALARHIANSDPRIRRVFDQWKGTEALDSPLERNEDLKAIALEETPWVRQARSESQARRQVGVLFDDNRLADELARAWRQLSEQQLADGSWSWFPGGRPNRFITLHITTGLGRLRHLGVDIDIAPAVRAVGALDRWLVDQYERILPENRNGIHLSSYIALYLYGRSFFLDDQPLDAGTREAFDFYVEQARTHWLTLANRQSQAHLAIALHRLGHRDGAQGIMRSIRERAVTDEEMGMFWRDTERSWWWYRAPIETQAMMIEAFDEVMGDAEAVAEAQVWLLKQKQTQNWRTTKATADAVYALLLRGANLLARDERVEVTVGDHRIEPEHVEAGTGFFEQRFSGPEIEPAMGRVTVRKVDEGVAWGSLHWHYLEDVAQVRPHTDTPLQLDKAVFVRVHTERGPVLNQVDEPLRVGDELVVRIVLRTDRDMEFIHLKDHRPSGTEPVHVLSRYRYQDGLAYYESTRDTASHFFIDYLPRGTYVFEYPLRVQHRGQYQTGLATVQSMYAPEFNSHSASVELVVE